MRLSENNIFLEKWFKLCQTKPDILKLNSGDKVKLISDKTDDILHGVNKVRLINSVINGAKGLTVGGGVVTCLTGVWSPLFNVGFIRITKDGADFYCEYTGNYPIQIGGVEVCYSSVDNTIFETPIDFTPPITVPPTQKVIFDVSDGLVYPMGDYISVMKGGGRLQEVVMDYIKDPHKNATTLTPYFTQQSTTSSTNQAIMYNNARFNKSIYTTADGIGTLTVNSGFTGLRFEIILTPDEWEVKLMLATNGTGQKGTIQNKINGTVTSGDPATESFIFYATTY